MKRQAGFTLVELIIVIVVLGILAAYAVPKFMSIDKEARAAVIKSLGGSVRTASDMVHALAIAQGRANLATGSISISPDAAGSVTVAYGYATPDAAGIQTALSSSLTEDITVVVGTVAPDLNSVTFTHKNALTDSAATCKVVYSYDGSSAVNVPAITVAATNCS